MISHSAKSVYIALESCLEGGGVNRRNLKFTTSNNKLQAGIRIRIKIESRREGENKSTKK
jgi:hypothetical protein